MPRRGSRKRAREEVRVDVTLGTKVTASHRNTWLGPQGWEPHALPTAGKGAKPAGATGLREDLQRGWLRAGSEQGGRWLLEPP